MEINVNRYKCPICFSEGFTEAQFTQHVVRNHPNTSSQVACPICGWGAVGDRPVRRFDLRIHVLYYHDIGQVEGDDSGSDNGGEAQSTGSEPREVTVGVEYEVPPPTAAGRYAFDSSRQLSRNAGGMNLQALQERQRAYLDSMREEQCDSMRERFDQMRLQAGAPNVQQSYYNTNPGSSFHQMRSNLSDHIASGVQYEEEEMNVGEPGPSTKHGDENVKKHEFLLDKVLDTRQQKQMNPEHKFFAQDLLTAVMAPRDASKTPSDLVTGAQCKKGTT